ncbi:hypothetical protein [Cryptosporidium parvum Iowa II]|uniref:DUF676 domain-containing protein n=2 Tax=Cryptosporidium parvum TaxID=5807 RepID=Q5CR67_CRYPI|nr:hypothetical protein [Cryptosporidium parvum Iowa II]EAK87886.1 conserved hypothetical protein [Cryptosporidium parvum Iowa II]QOY42253.1 Alpha/Beta hydrolase fold-containing protein [Cryptosporidium parvum]WKS77553.1 hypothetical protein CPCDC_4g1910 [Cryptosporidium sp. 43IA8]WRK31772.1 Alpha/Beta hydrolase fold-containing protein [Cryptosporidium parvum]|eukprot:QOY42253.1 hypothetical protein CPATCC_001876 [Cryptosporidium parvum]
MISYKEQKLNNLPENKYKSSLGSNDSFLESPNEGMSLEITFLISSIIICIVVSLISIVTQGKNQIRVNCSDPNHIVVMTHGWAGTPANMDVLAERILNKYNILDNSQWTENNQIQKSECILIYKIHSNWGYFRSIFITSDGIENGALRMSKELQQVIIRTPSLEKISFIGHSLGGLYNRAVLPLMSNYPLEKEIQSKNSTGLIGGLKPMNFISIGTPHKGVLSDDCTFFGFEILKVLFPWKWISWLPTISQLLLMDKNKPLIADMMNNMNMINPLSWFKHRHTIGSLKGDLLVPPTSASLLPFCIDNENLSLVSFNIYEFERRYQTNNIYRLKNFKQNYQLYSKTNKNHSNFVPNIIKAKSGEKDNLIEWITVIDSGNEKSYENKNEIYYRNIKNRKKLINLVKEKYHNFLNHKTLSDVFDKSPNGNLDKLVWMKTSVLFKSKIHRFFSHQLMMFCFENWGYFLLGNNFQLLDHIIENMKF